MRTLLSLLLLAAAAGSLPACSDPPPAEPEGAAVQAPSVSVGGTFTGMAGTVRTR